MAEQEKERFRGTLERLPEGGLRIRAQLEDGGTQTYEVPEDEVRGHMGELQGTTLTARDDEGQEISLVLDRVDGDDVEGHRFMSDRALKADVVPVRWR